MNNRIVYLILFLIFLCGPANAAVRLSVLPVEGGNAIRFGRVDLPSSADKEVRIRITSTDTEQYQVLQRMIEPFRNERGETLHSDVLLTASLDGSNGSGSLYVQNLEHVSFADQLVYTSSTQGVSDSFNLVYKIDVDKIHQAGQFTGQILFTVRPVNGGPQDEVVLNIFLEVGGDVKIRTFSSSGLDTVDLSTTNESSSQGYVKFSFDGNRGPLKIYQELISYPVTSSNDELSLETIEFLTSDGYNGKLKYQELTRLDEQRQLIYETQSTTDNVAVSFQLNPEATVRQVASDYYGKVRYTIEMSSREEIIDFDLNVNIDPVFEMKIDYPPEGMSFENLLPNSPAQFREVVVTVHSNLGKPYMVNQDVRAQLTNEEGEQIEGTHFLIKQEALEGNTGRLYYSDFASVPEGEAPLFFSDADGMGARFKVIYQLKPFNRMHSGSYKASIIYSLEEI